MDFNQILQGLFAGIQNNDNKLGSRSRKPTPPSEGVTRVGGPQASSGSADTSSASRLAGQIDTQMKAGNNNLGTLMTILDQSAAKNPGDWRNRPAIKGDMMRAAAMIDAGGGGFSSLSTDRRNRSTASASKKSGINKSGLYQTIESDFNAGKAEQKQDRVNKKRQKEELAMDAIRRARDKADMKDKISMLMSVISSGGANRPKVTTSEHVFNSAGAPLKVPIRETETGGTEFMQSLMRMFG